MADEVFAASVSVWVEDETEEAVYAKVEAIREKLDELPFGMSVSEDVHDGEVEPE